MAEATASISETETIVQEPERNTQQPVTLRLRKPKSDKKVKWTNETVDNEHMNKKKSKCCCIYEKPRMFGESSDEDDDDRADHCRGHKKKNFPGDDGRNHEDGGGPGEEPGPSSGS